jgi:hypothetical protein
MYLLQAAKTTTSPTHSMHSVASAAQKRGGFMVTPSVAPLAPAPMTTLSQASQVLIVCLPVE